MMLMCPEPDDTRAAFETSSMRALRLWLRLVQLRLVQLMCHTAVLHSGVSWFGIVHSVVVRRPQNNVMPAAADIVEPIRRHHIDASIDIAILI
jgi:hypothetical protein